MSSYRYHGRFEQTSFAANGISAWSAIAPPRLVTRLSCAHSSSNGMIESHAFRVVPYGKSVSTMSTLSSGMLFSTSRQSPLYSSMGQPPFFWRCGAACRARTCARPVMSRMLWPTELKRHKKNQLCCMELIMQKAGFDSYCISSGKVARIAGRAPWIQPRPPISARGSCFVWSARKPKRRA